MNKRRILAIVVAFAALAVHAQSAQEISQIVDAKELTYGQAAYIAMSFSAQDDAADEATEQDSLFAAVHLKWI